MALDPMLDAARRAANGNMIDPTLSFDPKDWSQAFCQKFPSADPAVMTIWFANALMRGFDEACRRFRNTPSTRPILKP